MDTKAAVIEMVNAIETLALFCNGLQAHGHGAVLVNARAACDYILAAESQNDPSLTVGSAAFECKTCSNHPDHTVCFTVPDLIANHPAIAAELGLTEANDE